MRWVSGILWFWALAAWGQVNVENPWTRPTPPNARLAAGYLTVVNAGAADRLVGAGSPAAARVEMHVNIKEGEIFRMREVKAFELPAKGRLEFKPAGAHLMFVDVRQPFRQGEKVPVTLKFEKAGELTIELEVTRTAPAVQHHKH
ncbi:MAG: copper chaperone PCu(A)C [Betaproteobacteria bacterium]